MPAAYARGAEPQPGQTLLHTRRTLASLGMKAGEQVELTVQPAWAKMLQVQRDAVSENEESDGGKEPGAKYSALASAHKRVHIPQIHIPCACIPPRENTLLAKLNHLKIKKTHLMYINFFLWLYEV